MYKSKEYGELEAVKLGSRLKIAFVKNVSAVISRNTLWVGDRSTWRKRKGKASKGCKTPACCVLSSKIIFNKINDWWEAFWEKKLQQIQTLGDCYALLRYMVKTSQSHNLKNTIGQICQIFQETKVEDSYHIKDKWEKELKTTITDTEWNQNFKDTNGWQGKIWINEGRNITNADASIGHEGSLNGLISVKMMWIICYGLRSHQISTNWTPMGDFGPTF